jgi:hypothetical protein
MTWQSHENNLFLFLLPLVKGKLRGIRFVSKKSNPPFFFFAKIEDLFLNKYLLYHLILQSNKVTYPL